MQMIWPDINHPETRLEDYKKIPDNVEHGEAYRQNSTRLIYLKKNGYFYKTVLKRTRDGKENYYLT